MGCSGCSTGRGTNSLPGGCGSNGGCSTGGCNQLNVFNWLSNMDNPSAELGEEIVEIRFKNGRKGYFSNINNVTTSIGDVVAVESSPGHDIGTISLTGELVKLQINKKHIKEIDIKKLYRKAKQTDIDKWQQAMTLEKPTLTQARKHAIELGLKMKICDVEYQGDKTKATFYYTAEERVDFRELIKIYAGQFKVRVEMRQIGARQEAARLGGVGACGRELCCSSWLTDFRSVTTSAARYQQLSLNPQKLAGQCGKLKCCLNFELDSYLDVLKDFPDVNTNIKTEQGEFFHFKSDIFKRVLWYINKKDRMQFVAVDAARVKEVIKANKEGIIPEILVEQVFEDVVEKELDYMNVVGQDDLTRFDNKKKKKGKPNNKRKPNNGPAKNNLSGGKPSGPGRSNKPRIEAKKNEPNSAKEGDRPKKQFKKGGKSQGNRNKPGEKKPDNSSKPKPD
jgi:cell fate regulator YaaT (PSP1 superfamily)|tara:strand:+ start:10887 stop:12236 length:1350 start_codon:yes stop_codon:yes gene_type:complete